MDRHSRRLSQNKGNKITTQSTAPLSSDGDDGDQLMVGSTLYTKSQGRWMGFASGRGNVNDGWHGSQRYVKILPTDFIMDDEEYTSSLYQYDYSLSGATGNGVNSIGVKHPHDGDGDSRGMAAFKSVPLLSLISV